MTIKFRTVGWDVLDLVPVKEERQMDAVVHQGSVIPLVSSQLESKIVLSVLGIGCLGRVSRE